MDAATDCPDNILLILKKRGLSGNKMFKYIINKNIESFHFEILIFCIITESISVDDL